MMAMSQIHSQKIQIRNHPAVLAHQWRNAQHEGTCTTESVLVSLAKIATAQRITHHASRITHHASRITHQPHQRIDLRIRDLNTILFYS
jgi:hypothetical protein